MKPDNLSFLIFVLLGIVAGLASFYLVDVWFAVAIVLIGLQVSSFLINFLTKEKKKMGWMMGNGGFIYILLWFIVWMILYNL